MNGVDIERAQREEVRWRILRILDAGRPIGVSETVIYRALHDASLGIAPRELRRELGYLADKGLVELQGRGGPVWSGELTALGVDVVEYSIAAPKGIGRPARYW